MKITVLAMTTIATIPESVFETKTGQHIQDAIFESDIDLLHEFAGRGCYKSWEKPNPLTEDTDDYLQHIVDQAHVSVFEHGQVSFYVEGVSRSLLLELERHGRNSHLSFSVESQRYVSTSKHHPEPVIPPLFKTPMKQSLNVVAEQNLRYHYAESLKFYDQTYSDMREAGVPVKQAREAARAFLPNATPVDFVVTADIRGWREVIEKRIAPGADQEIQDFAEKIERALMAIAPGSMQAPTREDY